MTLIFTLNNAISDQANNLCIKMNLNISDLSSYFDKNENVWRHIRDLLRIIYNCISLTNNLLRISVQVTAAYPFFFFAEW